MTPQQIADAALFEGDPFDLITEVPFRLVMEGQRIKSVSQPIRLDAKTQAACDAALSLQMAQQDAYPLTGARE